MFQIDTNCSKVGFGISGNILKAEKWKIKKIFFFHFPEFRKKWKKNEREKVKTKFQKKIILTKLLINHNSGYSDCENLEFK